MILDGGTTSLQMVQHLPLELRATVVTHSPTVAVALAGHAQVEVLMLGGRLFRHSMVNVGASVIEAASRFRADLFFLGVTGIHPTTGLTTGDADEAAMKRALSARAAETYVLGSDEKIGAASRYSVLPLEAVTAVITDKPESDPAARELTQAGVTLIQAA